MGKRYRDLGFSIVMLPTGSKNCITDVSGVNVGHQTVNHPVVDDDVAYTSVTAILPHEVNVFREKVIAARHVFNGFGKTTGLVQFNELGRLESPIMLTKTLDGPAVTQNASTYLLENK